MKKIVALILALAMCAALCACSSTKKNTASGDLTPVEPSPESASSTDLVGGWNIALDYPELNAPEEALKAFEKATQESGDEITPIAYLGSQVVAGANYAFLCKKVTNTTPVLTMMSVITVYADLSGGAEITKSENISVTDYTSETEVEFDPEELAGGWHYNTDFPGKLSEEAQKAFDKATEKSDVKYTPLGCIATQVVAGENFEIICSAEKDGAIALAILVIYADLNGNAEITSVSGFEFK